MDRATIIIADGDYLVPSLVLARQFIERKLNRFTDILVFLVDVNEATERLVTETFAGSGIIFRPLSLAALGIAPDAVFAKNHVPRTALARLAISDHIPATYEHIVYLDGDMQLVGDVTPLLTCEVPDGRVAAAAENFILWRDERGRQPQWVSDYLGTIGLERASQYFNSGLLAFRRETWKDIGPAALRFFNQNSALCRHHDQTALNAVCRGAWLPISPAYNFHTFLAPLLHAPVVPVKIVHFSSTPKPWQSPDSLWPSRFERPYRQLLSEHPRLGPLMKLYDIEEQRDALRPLRRLKRRLTYALDRDNRRKNFVKYINETSFFVS